MQLSQHQSKLPAKGCWEGGSCWDRPWGGPCQVEEAELVVTCLSLTVCRGVQQGTSSRLREICMLRSKDVLKLPRDTNRKSPVIRCAVSPWNSHWLALWTRIHQQDTCSFHAVCNVSGGAFVSHPAWQVPRATGSQHELGYWVLVHYEYLWCWLYSRAQWEFQYTKLSLFWGEAGILALIHNPWNSAAPKPQPCTCLFTWSTKSLLDFDKI